MSHRVTVYCSACNSPKYSRQTASGSVATAGYTVAVHRDFYKKNKGRRILLEIHNEQREKLMPYIQDIHGNSPDVIDIYIGERDVCDCVHHPWSGKRCSFRFLD